MAEINREIASLPPPKKVYAAYKAAVESIARKRAALTNAAAPAEKLADFSPAEPVRNLPRTTRTKFDEAAWKAISSPASWASGTQTLIRAGVPRTRGRCRS